MLSNAFPWRNPIASPLIQRDIASYRDRLQQSFRNPHNNFVPRRSRQQCLDKARAALTHPNTINNNTDLVRSALDLATHTLFCTERISGNPRLSKLTDFEHWHQLGTLLFEQYGDDVAELKLLLITGSLVEVQSIVTRQVNDLVGPYRATQDVEEWIRHKSATRPRGFDITSIKNLEAQYNSTTGTPIHELVERGLSKVIHLHSHDEICEEYQRIFVDRRSVPTTAVEGVAIFALSYKHEGRDLRMSKESFLEVCHKLKSQGFAKVHLWIDAVLKKSTDTWARRGLLPYTVLPIVIHNNEIYSKGENRIWLKLERVASSGRSGVLYTHPSQYNHIPASNCVTGDARSLVAACILVQDYDPQSVTFASDVNDLTDWATEHLTVATFRSFLGISRMVTSGGVSEGAKQESLYSAVLKYNESMPHRGVQYVARNRPAFPDSSADGGYTEIRNECFARNERLMTFVFRVEETVYKVRVSHGLGITAFRMDVLRNSEGTDSVERVHKTSGDERTRILHAMADALIRLAEKREESLWESIVGQRTGLHFFLSLPIYVVRLAFQLIIGKRFKEDEQTSRATVRFDEWNHWPGIFPVVDVGAER